MPFSFGRRPFSFGKRGGGGHLPRASSSSPSPSAPEPPPSSRPSNLYADLESTTPGAASPLGPSKTSDGQGVNFALWSSAASTVALCLLDPRTRQPAREIPLERTKEDPNVWAVTVTKGMPLKGVGYAYKVDGGGKTSPSNSSSEKSRWSPGTLLLDPRAPLVDSRSRFGVRDAREAFVPLVGSSFVGTFDFESEGFDWGTEFFFRFFFRFFFPVFLRKRERESLFFTPSSISHSSSSSLFHHKTIIIKKQSTTGDDARAKSTLTPAGKHVIYEVGVRPFTAAGGGFGGGKNGKNDSDDALRGTFAGLAARAPYLASLGVTAVELLPIFEYDELEFRRGKRCFLGFLFESESKEKKKLTLSFPFSAPFKTHKSPGAAPTRAIT